MKIFLSPVPLIKALTEGFDPTSSGWIAILAIDPTDFDKMVTESGLNHRNYHILRSSRLHISHLLRNGKMVPIIRVANARMMISYYFKKDKGIELENEFWVQSKDLPSDIQPADLVPPLKRLNRDIEVIV